MNWLYSFTSTEFLFVCLFVVFYGLYVWRTFRLARQLNTSAWGVVPKFFLRSSYLTLLIIALLGPAFGEGGSDIAAIGRDALLLIDVSRSMDATDVVPSRLERVKYDVQQLCDTLPADRFGLILAGSTPFVLSPLTADHDAVKQYMRDVHTSVSARGGTNLCEALELARQKILTDSSTQESVKTVVLFSDGENFGPCERGVVGRLRAAGTRLITVGVGTDAGSSIHEGRGYVRDEDRQIVQTRLNRSFLQELAREGRGQYLEVDAGGRYVNELAGLIRTSPGRVIDQRRIAVSTNKYYYFLLAALGLLALDVIITFRTFRL